MKHKFVKAYGPWIILLNRMGCVGLVMPWRSIYYLDNWNRSPEFRRHELVHIAQIERYGPICFSILYLYYLARYGYANHPLEIEAYGNTNGHMEHECTLSTPTASKQ